MLYFFIPHSFCLSWYLCKGSPIYLRKRIQAILKTIVQTYYKIGANVVPISTKSGQAISPEKGRRKRKRWEKNTTCHPNPTPAANTAGPSPTITKNSKRSRHCKLSSTIAWPSCWLLTRLSFCSQDIYTGFYAPPPESGGVLCYTLRNFECPSVRPSVCLSVRPSVRQRPPPFLYQQLLLQF